MEDKVILVDENDLVIGTMPKLEAHEKGLLHRAFSVFIFNDKRETMLHQRADGKYHSPGLWSNTCCSHPREGETNVQAGERRLQEEMGFSVPLKKVFSFMYKTDFSNGLTEHEFDHVLIGKWNKDPNMNPEEVKDWKWVDMEVVRNDVKDNPNNYTVWFQHLINDHFKTIIDYLE